MCKSSVPFCRVPSLPGQITWSLLVQIFWMGAIMCSSLAKLWPTVSMNWPLILVSGRACANSSQVTARVLWFLSIWRWPRMHPLRCFVFWVRQLYSGCPTGNLIAAPPNLRWEYKDPADASLCEVGSNALWQTIPHTGCQISMFRIVVDVLSWIFSRKMLFFYGRFRIAWYEHRIVTSDIPRH